MLRSARNDGVRSDSNFKQLSAVIVREGGRSSIPEAVVLEPRGCHVLDDRLRGHDDRVCERICVRVLAT